MDDLWIICHGLRINLTIWLPLLPLLRKVTDIKSFLWAFFMPTISHVSELNLFYLHLEHVLHNDAECVLLIRNPTSLLKITGENIMVDMHKLWEARCLEGQRNSNISNGVTCSNHINLRGCGAISILFQRERNFLSVLFCRMSYDYRLGYKIRATAF